MNIGTTGAPVRDRQVGGATLELLTPAVGRAATLGIDHQAPAVLDQIAEHGRSILRPVTSRSIGIAFSDSADDAALPSLVEEVVGGGGDDELATATAPGSSVIDSGVSRWLWWVGAKISRRWLVAQAEVFEPVDAVDLGSGEAVHHEPQRAVGDHLAGGLGGPACGPTRSRSWRRASTGRRDHDALRDARFAVRERRGCGAGLSGALQRRAGDVAEASRRGAAPVSEYGTVVAALIERRPPGARGRGGG